jgi:S-methylmethionine-dependent homocysteine/selenocysteine methylase
VTITIIDGGMGKELLRIGAPFRQPEWSALALMEAPERVLEAHRNFIAAGAEVIIANTYAVVPFHIGEEAFEQQGRSLASLAGELARRAADDAGRPVTVAASLPPLFGSYEPERFDGDRAPLLHRVLVEAQAPHVDMWIAETTSSIAEAVAALDAVATWSDRTLPFWLSVCVPDQPVDGAAPLRSGESMNELVDAVADRVNAILVNCSQPEMIDLAIVELTASLERRGSSIAIGGYANAFVPTARSGGANELLSEHRNDLTPTAYADIVDGWIAAGATIVGGCCGIHPEHIAELAARRSRRRVQG